MVNGNTEHRGSSFGRLKSKFRITNPDPSSLPPHRSQGRQRHTSVDSYQRTPHERLEHERQLYEYGDGSDGGGTVASQFHFLQNHNRDVMTARRSRRASVPIPPRSAPLDDTPGIGRARDQQLSQLIQEISDPHAHVRAARPRSKSPCRRRESMQVPPILDENETRTPPKLVFDALARVPHVGGRAQVDRILDLHEWMMIYQLDLMDQEERDAVRAQDAEDDEISTLLDPSPQSSRPPAPSTKTRKDYTRRTVFGVALRYVSIYASTSVLLSSTSVSTPSSTVPHPIQGHTLSLPILLVSTIEELYRTGLYTPSLFRLLPSPLRLRELVSVFNQRDLPRSVIVTPRPKARERGLSTRFGGSVSLHLEGVGEVGSVVSTWLGALPGGVVGVDAYLNNFAERKDEKMRKGDRGGEGNGSEGGWWRAVWEWCQVEEDDLSPYRPGLNTKQRVSASSIYSSVHPVPYDGTHVPNSPRQVSVSEIDKIHVAQLLLHLLPQPAFDVLVYLLAFFSQVVLVEGTNGVGVRDVGGMFGGSVFGDDPAKAGKRGRWGGEADDGGARIMCWFLRRWDRISNGLFDIPLRLVEERRLELAKARLQDTVSAPDHDIESSSTYSYSKDDQHAMGYAQKMEITPDVHTVPLPLSNAGKALSVTPTEPPSDREAGRREDASVERGRRRRSGRDSGVVVPRRETGEWAPVRDPRPGSFYVEDRSPARSPPPRHYSRGREGTRHRRRSPGMGRRDPRGGSGSWHSSISEDDAGVTGQRSHEGADNTFRRHSVERRPTGQDYGDSEVAASTMGYGDGGGGEEGHHQGPSEPNYKDQEYLESATEYENTPGRERAVSMESTLPLEDDDGEGGHRPRRDTEATMVESEHEFSAPKSSVDQMLDDMMHSYEARDFEPPAMDDSAKTLSPRPHGTLLASPAHDEPATAAVILPLHIKHKHTAESLLAELRKEGSMERSVSGSRETSGSVLVATPVMELHRSESGTFSVSSTADLEARLMDVTTDDELHSPFAAGLILQSQPEGVQKQATDKSRVLSASRQHRLERQGTVRAASKDRSSSKRRASVYELEAELQQVKERNKQAMGALEMATRQINTLEAKLKVVGLEDGPE